MELILFAARAERLRARRALITEIVAGTMGEVGREDLVGPAWAGAALLALEDGFRLHRLIDPGSTPADSFVQAVARLQRAMGIDGGPRP